MIIDALLGLSGRTGPIVYVSSRTHGAVVTNPDDARAGYRLGTDGILYLGGSILGSEVYVPITGEWLIPPDAVAADLYECMATLTSGTVTSGTTGSWLSLASDRTWTKDETVVGTASVTFRIDVRLIGSSELLASALITLNAVVSP